MIKRKDCLALSVLFMAFITPVFAQQTPKEKADTSIIEESKESILDNIPVITLDEGDAGSSQSISSQLTSGRDPFQNGATFHFNIVRFRFRGYESDAFANYLNGIPIENLDNGFTPYSQWGGLNDVFRNRDITIGLRPTGYGYGDIGGVTYLDTRASKQRKQTIIGYSYSNRVYDNMVKLTHSTGLNKHGWAFTLSGSGRWSTEGFMPGTYFRGVSGFIGIDKRINDRHLLSLTLIAAPSESGRSSASVLELQKILGVDYYNPSWGYQNGKKRNANVSREFTPISILTHEWKINDKMSLTTAAGYVTGTRKYSSLDWYNAADPRPYYYRYLPSYFAQTPELYNQLVAEFKAHPEMAQVNWSALYNTNYISNEVVHNVNGVIGNDVRGKRSHYAVQDRVTETRKMMFNTVLNASLSSNIDFSAGASYQYHKNKYYNEMNDLLGGDFFVDINQFAERDFSTDPSAPQNDLNNPNRLVRKGDKYGNNYDMDMKKATAWAQSVFKFNKMDFFVALEHTYTSFVRTGNTKVGLFPNNSFGRAKTNDFYNYAFKAGTTYKIDGRNYIFANASYATKAPFFDNVYVSPRTRDQIQDNVTSEKILSGEAGYAMNAPKLKLRVTGYFTDFKDGLNVLNFYDDQYRTFVNYALSNIGRRHYGTELGVDAKIYQGLSFNAAANIGRYFYTTRQTLNITQDNSSDVLGKDILVYSKNFNVPTVQESYTAGLYYRDPHFWSISVNVNYFDQLWLDINPARRTIAAVEGLDPQSSTFKSIIAQTRLPKQTTVDANLGWSYKLNKAIKDLKKNYFLNLNVSVTNLLDKKDILIGGSEAFRFDYVDKNSEKFPTRYYLAFGRTFNITASLRF